jgi:hypothetical protein
MKPKVESKMTELTGEAYQSELKLKEDYIKAKKAQLFDRGISSRDIYPTGRFGKVGELFYFDDENLTIWKEGGVTCFLSFFRDELEFLFMALQDGEQLAHIVTSDATEVDREHEKVEAESPYDIALRKTLTQIELREAKDKENK